MSGLKIIFLRLYEEVLFLFKRPLNILVWLVILFFTSLIFPFQILMTFFWFFFYSAEFFIKYIKFKFKFKNTKPMEYKEFFKYSGDNINIIVFYHFFFNIPKKWSFFYFYNLVKFLTKVENKNFFLKFFLSFEFLKKFFKKILLRLIVRLLTSFPLIVLENTTYITRVWDSFWNKNWKNFIDFYSSFLLEISVSYNSVYNKIKDRKVKFDSDKIYTNPPKPDKPIKIIVENILNDSSYLRCKASINSLVKSSEISFIRLNISEPTLNLEIKDKFNQTLIDSLSCDRDQLNEINLNLFEEKVNIENNINPNVLENYKIVLKSDPRLEKINRLNHYNFSGYKENLDFKSRSLGKDLEKHEFGDFIETKLLSKKPFLLAAKKVDL